MSLDSTIHADATVAPHSALPTSFAIQVPSVDQSDRKVPINLRQPGPKWSRFPSGLRSIQVHARGPGIRHTDPHTPGMITLRIDRSS